MILLQGRLADVAVDLDSLDTELSSIEVEMLRGEESEDDEDTEFDVADTVGKALTLITQV
jgi:hypothetical protein